MYEKTQPQLHHISIIFEGLLLIQIICNLIKIFVAEMDMQQYQLVLWYT